MAHHPSLHPARLLLVAATIVAWPGFAVAAVFPVSSTIDAVDGFVGDGVCATAAAVCTLRAAIQEANDTSGPDTIVLLPGIYRLTIAGRGETNAATGDLNVKTQLTIIGGGATTTIIDGNALDRVFVANVAPLTLNDLTVQNGYPGASPGGCISNMGVNLTLTRVVVKSCQSDAAGGGIFAVGGPATVTVTDTTITQNVVTGAGGGGGLYLTSDVVMTMTRATVSANAAGFGAGIRVFGSAASPSTVTVTDSVITQNVVTNIPAGGGGGLELDGAITATLNRVTVSNNSGAGGAGILFSGSTGSAAMLTVVDSTFTQNVSPSSGGGMYLQSGGGDATATITRTTISANSANQGGGVSLFGGKVTFSNATISGNTATDSGGAIYRAPVTGTELTLINVTVASNSSAVIGAVHAIGQISVRNTIIANSTGAAPSNCSTAPLMIDLGNNLEFPGTSCGFDLASDRQADPLLDLLAGNGGPTRTMALIPGSPAIDTGDDAACAATPVSGLDQRGEGRAIGAGAHCDMGAYERVPLVFTDNPIVAGMTIRALHILELRFRIDVIRVARGLAAYYGAIRR
jgi:predicted outer membrane repeat protein